LRRHSGRESGDGLCSQVIAVGALDPRDAGPGLASFEVGDYRANPAVVVVSGRKVQLGQNVADVLLDGGFGEPELTRNAGVRTTLGHQRKHLLFARAERVKRVLTRATSGYQMPHQ